MKNSVFKIIKLLFVLSIIAGVGTVLLKNAGVMLQQKNDDDKKTDLLLIQAKVKLIKGKSDVNSNTDEYVGVKVSELENEVIKDFLRNIKIPDSDFEKYYVLYYQDFEKMGIVSELANTEDDNYIVNYETAEVICVKGVFVDNMFKYKLSDIVKKEEEKKWILYNRIEVDK